MHRFTLIATLALVVSALPHTKRAVDFFNPTDGGGSWLDVASGTDGEPLNVVISGRSSPEVLTQSGFLNFAQAIGFSTECFGQHRGAPQTANLGDGRGQVPQQSELRQFFSVPILGTCLESLFGGNHFRIYPQTGPQANSGALFLAVSQEQNLSASHDIVPNGYNIGRDDLVAAAVGRHSFFGFTYDSVVESLPNLLPAGAQGVNHGIAQDGIIKMLTITVVR